MSTQYNSETPGLVVGGILLLIGLALIVLPGLLGVDMMQAGYGLAFIGIFLFIAGGVTSIFYVVRFRQVQKMLAGEGLLAHWKYQPGEWQEYSDAEFERQKGEKAGLFWVVTFFIVVIGGIFFVADPEAGKWVLLTLLLLDVVLAVLAFGWPRWEYHHNQESVGEALITSNAIYLNRRLHMWNSLGSRLDQVEILDTYPPVIAFEYSYPTRHGRQTDTVRVPIPQGQAAAAQQLVERMKRKPLQD